MSSIDCMGRFCPKCQTDTKRDARGECQPCKTRRAAKYRAAHATKVKAGIAAWRVANKSKANASSTSWAAAHPERIRASASAWKKANPSIVRIHNHNRRSRIKDSGGILSKDLIEKLFVLQKGRCPCCRQPLGDDYHLDHKMPLILGGSNTDDNMQLMRAGCNLQKQASHPVDFMQSRGFLL